MWWFLLLPSLRHEAISTVYDLYSKSKLLFSKYIAFISINSKAYGSLRANDALLQTNYLNRTFSLPFFVRSVSRNFYPEICGEHKCLGYEYDPDRVHRVQPALQPPQS